MLKFQRGDVVIPINGKVHPITNDRSISIEGEARVEFVQRDGSLLIAVKGKHHDFHAEAFTKRPAHAA